MNDKKNKRASARPSAPVIDPKSKRASARPAPRASRVPKAPPTGFENEIAIGDGGPPPDVAFLQGVAELREETSARRRKDAADSSQLLDIERQLEDILSDADALSDDPAERRRAAEALSQIAARLSGEQKGEASPMGQPPRGTLSTDYYFRQWSRFAMRERTEDVDDFGFDPSYAARVRPLLDFLFRRWFRTEVEGMENIPAEGKAMMVANHSGAFPLDGAMLKTAVRLGHPAGREVRWLAEDFIFHFPFAGVAMNRVGAVRACQENAERLLAQHKLVAVFPEGVHGMGKLYAERYKLQRFGRGGYIKLALRTGAPIVPTAIVGAEETHPLLFKINAFTQSLGLPFIPVTPLFPLLGPIGLTPLPVKWRIAFGEVFDLREYEPSAAEDMVLVNRLNERVRGAVQSLLERTVQERGSSYSG